jgi:hypothetical protein
MGGQLFFVGAPQSPPIEGSLQDRKVSGLAYRSECSAPETSKGRWVPKVGKTKGLEKSILLFSLRPPPQGFQKGDRKGVLTTCSSGTRRT